MAERKISNTEREALMGLIRKREKVMRAQATERTKALMAEFDQQSAQTFRWDDDVVWKQAVESVREVFFKAQEQIASRCVEMGMPKEFAPKLDFGWSPRGDNAFASRRQELRQAALSKVTAMEAEAIRRIEELSLSAQTELLARGLESEAAREFLESMPKMDALMPTLKVGDIQALLESKAKGLARAGLSLGYYSSLDDYDA